MIEYRVRYYHNQGSLYTSIDATDLIHGDIAIEKTRFDLPQIGNEIKISGEFVLSGRAYDVLIQNNYDDETQNNGRDLIIQIRDGDEQIDFYVDTQKIKWDKERCLCFIGDGNLGGLQKMNDDLKKAWNEEVILDGLGTDIDISRRQYRVVRRLDGNIEEWNVFNISYIENYWNKVRVFTEGTLVTGTERQNVLNALENQDPDYLNWVGYDEESVLPTPTQPFIHKSYTIWIIDKDTLEVVEPSFTIHENFYNQSGYSIVKVYKNFMSSNDGDATLIDAIKLEDAINHILLHYFPDGRIKYDTDSFNGLLTFLAYNFFGGVTNRFHLVQKSNAKRPWAVEKAKNYGLSLQDIIDNLCSFLRCQWFISKDEDGGYLLSIFNPRWQFNQFHSLYKYKKVPGLYSPYVFNAYKVDESKVEVLNIYKYLDSQPEYVEIEMKENARIETLRNITKEHLATGGRVKKSISLFSTDWRGVIFQDFGKDSPYNANGIYDTFRDVSPADLPVRTNVIRKAMEEIGNEVFSDEGFLLYNEKYANPNQTVINHNAPRNYLSRNGVSWWLSGDYANKEFSAWGQLEALSRRDLEEVQIVNCSLVPEEMEVMEKDGKWYFAVQSSYNLNSRILSIKFETR